MHPLAPLLSTKLPSARRAPWRVVATLATTSAIGCVCAAPPATPARSVAPASTATLAPLPGEPHFAELRQLTFGGENAEAYWSWGGRELVLQSKQPGAGCDRIYRLAVGDANPTLVPVSSGEGATTCSYFLPGDRHILYSSTHLGGAACPPVPDHSQGYVWPLHDHDIFKAALDGGELSRLTTTPGYDAEATVCGKDGSIVFTSTRDGDLELYRMDADGGNVRRLTNAPGYDGGAFFSADCTKIVWRASRPKPGKELDDYRALLQKNMVRPTRLEIYVAAADGSDPVQVTYLGAASFAPYFFPSGRRILFSSNYGDPRGREFDIWAIDERGTNLERITSAPGFDGFPMFSPDGQTLAFASNRATPPGAHDTNVFVARWVDTPTRAADATPAAALGATSPTAAAERVLADVEFLADPAREGRGIGTQGLERAGAFLEQRMASLGLLPGGDKETFRQNFEVTTALALGPASRLRAHGKAFARDEWTPLGFSASAKLAADLVFADYGIVLPGGRDDYAKKVVKNKIVLVRRFVPEEPAFSSTDAKRRYGDLRYKAWIAKERGARALLVVDLPTPPAGAPADWKAADDAKLPPLAPEGPADAGIPVALLKRAAGAPLVEALLRGQPVRAEISVELTAERGSAFNVVGRIPAAPGAGPKLPGAIVLGAHYDHLGFGGRHSLAPGERAPHVGADDNASGTAALLEIARELAQPANRAALRRDVVIAAFSGEESGLLGSSHFVHAGEQKQPGAIAPKDVFAMANLDMVGRLRENRVQVLGADTAAAWPALLEPACEAARVECALSGDGYGPSDQMSFYVAGVPVLHFFTGAHSDYHKPSDTPARVNAGGAARIAALNAALAIALAKQEQPLGFRPGARGPAPRGDVRNFNASLGTIPDYAGPGPGKSGVLLGGVRPGGAAEKAGLRRGDILVRIGKHEIRGVEDLMFVLNASKPGERTRVVVHRDGKPLEVEVTFQESQRPR